jgi:hypothetical protein
MTTKRSILLSLLVLLMIPSCVLAAPSAVDDTATIAEDSAITIAVLANDSYGTLTSVNIVSGPTAGTAEVNADNTITYDPITDFYGTDTFTYQVVDGSGSSTAQVTITVMPVNDTPQLKDYVFVTEEDTPVTIRLEATDPELDPFYPEDDLLKFAIVTGPTHGTVDGDLTQLNYETPHTAFVGLLYTPEIGFSGTDAITFSVTDIGGAVGTAQIQIKVGPSKEAGVLSGRWTGSFTFDGQSFSFTAFKTTIAAVYQIGSFRSQATAIWSMDSFTSLVISANFPLGELSISSTASFDPMGPDYFRYLRTTSRTSFFDFSLSHTFYLAANQTDSYNTLIATWQIDGISVTSKTRLNGLSFCFASEDVTARWTWADCDIDMDARLSIDQQGFDYFSYTIREIPILPQDTIGVGIFLRLKTTFSLVSKYLDASLYCKSDWFDCFRVLCEVIGGEGLSIDAVSLYGLQFQTTFPDGITLRTDTALSEEKNASLTGYSEYFERFRVSGPTQSCCGGPGQWEIHTYFQSSGTTLFDWGMTSISATEVLSDNIRFSIGLDFRAIEPVWEIKIGWEVSW